MSQDPDAPPPSPYGQPPAARDPDGPGPYGQSPPSNPYDPHQRAAPGYAVAYGGLGRDPDKRPGTVLAAAIITYVLSVVVGLVLVFFLVSLVLDSSGFLSAFDDGLSDGSGESDDVGNVFYVGALSVVLVGLFWCVSACVLATLTLRRRNWARIALVVSSVMTALLSVLAIFVLLPLLTLGGGIAVVVLLFVGGANEWFADRGRPVPDPSGLSAG